MRGFAAAAGLACLAVHSAWGHAFLDRANPPVGAELAAAPPNVTLTFTQGVEPLFSSITVEDSRGARVDKNDVHEGSNRTVLSVGVGQLAPGTYTVTWHVTSVDTHKTEGRFQFTVKG